MKRQTVYVLILALALFAGSYLGGRTPQAEGALSTSARLKRLEKQYKDLDTRTDDIEAALQAAGGSAELAPIMLVIGEQLGDATLGTKGKVWEEIESLQTSLTAVNGNVDDKLRASEAAVDRRVAAVETSPTLHKLAQIANKIDFSTDTIEGVPGPHIIFKGANVHIRNGAGGDTGDGLGNLILGYDRIAAGKSRTTGSHTLVVGDGHSWKGKSGIVAGERNSLGLQNGVGAVLGGTDNTVTAPSSVVVSGLRNKILSGVSNAIVAGHDGTINGGASSGYHSILGGPVNTITSAWACTIAGGERGSISGNSYSSIAGGYRNAISSAGNCNSINGGATNRITAGQFNAIAGGNDNQIVAGEAQFIGSGWNNKIAGGWNNSILSGSSSEIRAGVGSVNSILGGVGNYVSKNTIAYAEAWQPGGNVVVGGNANNTYAESCSVISGGYNCSIGKNSATNTGSFAVVSGGNGRWTDVPFRWVAGQ